MSLEVRFKIFDAERFEDDRNALSARFLGYERGITCNADHADVGIAFQNPCHLFYFATPIAGLCKVWKIPALREFIPDSYKGKRTSGKTFQVFDDFSTYKGRLRVFFSFSHPPVGVF